MSHPSMRDFFDRPPRAPRRRRRSRARLAIWISAGSLAVLLVVVGVAVLVVAGQLSGNVRRIPGVFSGLNPAGRPGVPAAYQRSMTILVAGSDYRAAAPGPGPNTSFLPGSQRSDVLMLVHIDADRKHVSVVSIPRDSWVPVPGRGIMKINAAMSLGGPPLMIATVEKLTGVRIDHYAVLDFGGFQQVVQVLGGVQVEVAAPASNGGINFHRGVNNLDPVAALAYVRQRYGLPGGDLSRIQRQQNLIRAILAKVAAEHLTTDPVAAYRLLSSVNDVLSVDNTFSDSDLVSLAVDLSRLRGSDFTFLTAPVKGFGVEQGQDVVYLDQTGCSTLWNAVRNDAVATWAQQHPAAVTPPVPN